MPPGTGPRPDFCRQVNKLRAIEGSSEYGSEQLAIPILAVAAACVPAFLMLAGLLFVPKYLPWLECAKVWLAGSMVLLVLGIDTVQGLTFDCRWWGNQHHGNAQSCHDGLNLYIAATLLLLCGQIILLVCAVHFMEVTRREIMK